MLIRTNVGHVFNFSIIVGFGYLEKLKSKSFGEMLKFAKICKYSIIDNIFLFYNLVEHYVSSFLQKDIILKRPKLIAKNIIIYKKNAKVKFE
jgi:hypothetical protein